MITFSVLGLGPTLRYFKPSPGIHTIGVNDIFRFQSVQDLVVLDAPPPPGDLFPGEGTGERLQKEKRADLFEVIARSTPTRSWSQLEYWRGKLPGFTLIKLIPPIDGLALADMIDGPAIPAGLDSTFTAACLAYKLGAEQIIIFGADFNSHTLAQDPRQLEQILGSWEILRVNLRIRGVELKVYSKESRLSVILPWIAR